MYEKVKNNYKGEKINFYLGDSLKILGEILINIEGDSLIFLDGHCSNKITGIGEKFCFLFEELDHIISNHKGEAIIIIDDFRLFGTRGWREINIEDTLYNL